MRRGGLPNIGDQIWDNHGDERGLWVHEMDHNGDSNYWRTDPRDAFGKAAEANANADGYENFKAVAERYPQQSSGVCRPGWPQQSPNPKSAWS